MTKPEHILPVARGFEDNDHFHWQISRETGISQDYSNELGTVLLWNVLATIEAYEFMKKPIDTAQIRDSLMGYLVRARGLPNYSEYMRDRVESYNSFEGITRKYAADDFIREENIENVRKLELLAGDIRNEAQPQEQAVEANLTEVLDKTHAALEIVYGKPSDLSREECNLFLSLFETYGIVVT